MPVMETERLLLREMTMGDFPELFPIFSDAETMRYYPEPFSEARVREWIGWNMQSYKENGYGLYAVVLKATGEVIGDCGLIKQRLDDRDEIEIGYHVRRDLWGRGYAPEAARACVRYAFETLEALRLISLIRPVNLASRRVAEKVGMTVLQEVMRKNILHCVCGIERE